MGKEKKKWFQKGAFEDGYQFGDVFRTIKNAVTDKGEEKANNNEKTLQYKKEKQTKKANKVNTSLVKVENGKLKVDPAVRLYGFENEVERQNYIKENPNLYAVLGGYKYEPNMLSKNYTPLNDEGKKAVQQAQERDAYLHSLQYKIDNKDAFKAQEKRSKGIALTNREIEAETTQRWFKGNIDSNEIVENIEKAKAINDAVAKLNSGEEISFNELLLLTENGGENFTNGNTYKTIDFLANDNPENISAYSNFKYAVEKEKRGEELSNQEKADISNYLARHYIKKSIVKDKYTLENDIKENAENINTMAAVNLYNDAIYGKGVDKVFSQMQLYTNTGFTKYLQDTINTATILSTESAHIMGISDDQASDVLKRIPKGKYEIANDTVGEYFTRNDMKLSKFVQDTTVSLANNAIPMLLSGVSGGASMIATGLSVFGSSYTEAVELAPEAEEWQYFLYAGMNTTTEVCMQKLLSGDTSVFNDASKFTESMFKSLTKNISNKFLIGGAKLLSNGTGEFFEETMQGLLSPVLQKLILGVDTISILSSNRTEQFSAMKNALYDGLVGFSSACVSTGTFGNNSIDNINQKKTIGAYYNKVFNDSNINTENVALYLKEISNGENSDLNRSADMVLNGDKTDIAIADMMIDGMEQSRASQEFVYTKIGEQLNQNNRYEVYNLIRQYDRLTKSGIEFSESITDTYNELVNAEEISRDRFNYLVGKLSTTMDAVAPRASVVNEIKKKINGETEKNGLLRGNTTRNDNFGVDEKAFVEGLWDNDINKEHSIKPDVIDNPETTLKTKLGFIDDSGQLTFIPTNVMITNTKVIAGIDVKNVFRDAKKYVDKYGGNESDYRKVVGKIESAKYIFDIHFVEDKNGNEYDFKIKSKTLKEGK